MDEIIYIAFCKGTGENEKRSMDLNNIVKMIKKEKSLLGLNENDERPDNWR
jgi:hypothetical protein